MDERPESSPELEPATRAWVERELNSGERLEGALVLHGGWSARMLELSVSGPAGERALVLRSIVSPRLAQEAEGMLRREADALRFLAGTELPAARLVAVDSTARHCRYPSLLMTKLPGAVQFSDAGAEHRAELLARLLVRIHRLQVPADRRPRAYELWTTAESVEPLAAPTRPPQLWARATELIRPAPPRDPECFLHRDFHPGNVLMAPAGDGLSVCGVVDWVETSWGPAGIDVAHCASNLAMLHGAALGMSFAGRYVQAGGQLSSEPENHRYWCLRDALAFAPDIAEVAAAWRRAGRPDLTDQLVSRRLEDYIEALLGG